MKKVILGAAMLISGVVGLVGWFIHVPLPFIPEQEAEYGDA